MTDMTLGEVAALRRQEAEARAQSRSGSSQNRYPANALPAPRRRRPWTNYATVDDVNAAFAVTAAETNAAFARRKDQADAIHQRLDQRLYYVERMLRRLTHPITIPEGWFEIEDRPLTDWPSTPPDAEVSDVGYVQTTDPEAVEP